MNQLALEIKKSFFTASEEESFNRIITTAKGSRVVRPFFGSLIHELIDKNMDEEWKMLFSKYLLECFYDENHNPWDMRLIPKRVKIISIDATNGSVNASIDFDEEITISIGGF
uniref:hypothetical protein n=1 Tax=Aliarcobacter sp. TaxID=2321116 RepID=UPI004047C21B